MDRSQGGTRSASDVSTRATHNTSQHDVRLAAGDSTRQWRSSVEASGDVHTRSEATESVWTPATHASTRVETGNAKRRINSSCNTLVVDRATMQQSRGGAAHRRSPGPRSRTAPKSPELEKIEAFRRRLLGELQTIRGQMEALDGKSPRSASREAASAANLSGVSPVRPTPRLNSSVRSTESRRSRRSHGSARSGHPTGSGALASSLPAPSARDLDDSVRQLNELLASAADTEAMLVAHKVDSLRQEEARLNASLSSPQAQLPLPAKYLVTTTATATPTSEQGSGRSGAAGIADGDAGGAAAAAAAAASANGDAAAAANGDAAASANGDAAAAAALSLGKEVQFVHAENDRLRQQVVRLQHELAEQGATHADEVAQRERITQAFEQVGGELRALVVSRDTQLTALQAEVTAQKQEAMRAQVDAAAVANELAEVRQQHETNKQRADDAEAEAAKLRRALDSQQEALATAAGLAEQWKNEQASLTQRSDELVRERDAMRTAMRSEMELMQQQHATLAKQLAAQREAAELEAAAAREDLQRERSEHEAALAQRRKDLTLAKQAIRQLEQQLEEKAEEAEDVQQRAEHALAIGKKAAEEKRELDLELRAVRGRLQLAQDIESRMKRDLDEARERVRVLEADREASQGKLTQTALELAATKDSAAAATAACEAAMQQVQAARARERVLAERSAELDMAVKAGDAELQQAHEQVVRECRALEQRCDAAEAEAAKAKAAAIRARQQAAELQAEVDEAKRDANEAIHALAEARTRADVAEGAQARLQRQVGRAQAMVEAASQPVVQLALNISAEVSRGRAEEDEEAATVARLVGRTTQLQQRAESAEEQCVALRARLASAEQRAEQAEQTVQRVDGTAAENRRELTEMRAQLQQQLQAVQATLRQRTDEAQGAEARARAAEREARQLRDELDAAHARHASSVQQREQMLETMHAELVAAKGTGAADTEELQRRVQRQRKEIQHQQQVCEMKEDQLRIATDTIARLRVDLAAVQASASSASSADLTAVRQSAEAQAELTRLRAQVRERDAALDSARQRIAALEADASPQAVVELQQQLEHSKSALAARDAEFHALQKQLGTVTSRLKVQVADLLRQQTQLRRDADVSAAAAASPSPAGAVASATALMREQQDRAQRLEQHKLQLLAMLDEKNELIERQRAQLADVGCRISGGGEVEDAAVASPVRRLMQHSPRQETASPVRRTLQRRAVLTHSPSAPTLLATPSPVRRTVLAAAAATLAADHSDAADEHGSVAAAAETSPPPLRVTRRVLLPSPSTPLMRSSVAAASAVADSDAVATTSPVLATRAGAETQRQSAAMLSSFVRQDAAATMIQKQYRAHRARPRRLPSVVLDSPQADISHRRVMQPSPSSPVVTSSKSNTSTSVDKGVVSPRRMMQPSPSAPVVTSSKAVSAEPQIAFLRRRVLRPSPSMPLPPLARGTPLSPASAGGTAGDAVATEQTVTSPEQTVTSAQASVGVADATVASIDAGIGGDTAAGGADNAQDAAPVSMVVRDDVGDVDAGVSSTADVTASADVTDASMSHDDATGGFSPAELPEGVGGAMQSTPQPTAQQQVGVSRTATDAGEGEAKEPATSAVNSTEAVNSAVKVKLPSMSPVKSPKERKSAEEVEMPSTSPVKSPRSTMNAGDVKKPASSPVKSPKDTNGADVVKKLSPSPVKSPRDTKGVDDVKKPSTSPAKSPKDTKSADDVKKPAKSSANRATSSADDVTKSPEKSSTSPAKAQGSTSKSPRTSEAGKPGKKSRWKKGSKAK